MTEYTGKFYKEISETGFSLFADTNTIEEAAVKVMQEFKKNKFLSEYNLHGRIINPKGEDYVILKKGKWLVDTETGEKLSDLEEKVGEKQ